MSNELNRNPEQKARDQIDATLRLAGWHVQSRNDIDFSVGIGVAIREYQTSVDLPIISFSSIKNLWG